MATVILVHDSPLGATVQAELVSKGFKVVTPETWRATKQPVEAIVFATEASLKEPRKTLDSVEVFRDQWSRLVEKEMRASFELIVEAMPAMVNNFKTSGKPSTVVFLASKIIRSPNSPNQIMSSVVKRAVSAFSGSLFFERRMDGIRVTCINPTPQVTPKGLAQSLVYPLIVDNRVCIESIDLIGLKTFPKPTWKWGACFVSGATRGIGKGIALRIAKEFKIPMGLLGRDQAELKKVSEECAAHCGRDLVRTFAFDARETDKLKGAIDSLANEFGGISILVWSAGINRRANSVSPDGKKFADPKVFHELMDINFSSSMYATQYALPHMICRPEGASIFYVGSRTVRVGNAPGQQAYVASKMAMNGFAASVQQEVKGLGVRVVTLNVGLVDTELGSKAPKKGNFALAPPDTMMKPDHIADAVVFTLRMDPAISPMNFDICGVNEEFRDKDGNSLKLSNL